MLVVIATLVTASPATSPSVAAAPQRSSRDPGEASLPPAVRRLTDLRLGAAPTRLVQVGGDLFALGLSKAGLGGTIVRIDLARGREVARTTLNRVVIAGVADEHAVYVILGDVDLDSPHKPTTLLRLDRATLHVRAQVTLPLSEASAVLRPEAVYVLEGARLERRDRTTLEVVQRLAIPDHSDRMGSCDSMDSDPTTPIVWLAVTLDDGTFRAMEISTRGLLVLHTSQQAGGVCGAKVSAIPTGMWAGFPTGLLSTALRFDTSTGESGARLHSAKGWHPEPNSAVYAATPTSLWILSDRSLTCADVSTGLVVGNSDLGEPVAFVMAVTEHRVFVSRPDGLVVYAPTSACLRAAR